MNIRKIVGIMALLLVLLCAHACAATIADVPADRVSYNLPPGLSAEVTYTDGHLNIHVDTDKTDWNKVLGSHYVIEVNQVYYGPIINAPEGAGRHIGTGFSSGIGDDYMLNWLETTDYSKIPRKQYLNGYYFADYIESTGMLLLKERTPNTNVVRWFNSDGSEVIATEKLEYSLTFTHTNPVKVTVPRYPANYIAAAELLSDSVRPDMDICVENGYLRYSYIGTSTSYVSAPIAFLCPDHDADLESGWTCKITSMTSEQSSDMQMVEVNGEQRLACVYSRSLKSDSSVSTRSFNIHWTDPDGNAVSSNAMHIIYFSGEPRVWPSYVEEWEPIAASQMPSIDVYNDIEGLEASYEDGIFRVSMDEENMPTGKSLEDIELTVKVTPPTGGVYYRWNRSAANNIYGPHTDFESTQKQIVSNAERYKASVDPFVLSVTPFTAHYSPEMNLTVYLSNGLTNEFGGGVHVLYWYNSNKKLISQQWLVEKIMPFHRLDTTPSIIDEWEIAGRLTIPVIMVSDETGTGNYNLIITESPTSEADAVFYELNLQDRWGNERDLPSQCYLYLPYPENLNMFTPAEYTVRHLDSDLNVKEVFTDEIVRTPYGLRIQVSSLSPFVMQWAEGEGYAPETLELPSGLVTLEESAFDGVAAENVIIPPSCKTIAANAFANCPNLKVVSLPGGEISIDPLAFPNREDVTLYVPNGSPAHTFAVDNGFTCFPY